MKPWTISGGLPKPLAVVALRIGYSLVNPPPRGAELRANTTRAMPVRRIAVEHIQHGSQLVYRVAPDRSRLPRILQALRIAAISAWPVGSKSVITRFSDSARS